MQKTLSLILVTFTLIAAPLGVKAQNCPANTPTARPAGISATQSNYSIAKIRAQIANRNTYPNLVLLTSHRGNWEYCPENTLESFQSSWDLGAVAVEMDVRVSGPGTDSSGNSWPNGEMFLTHDFDLRGEAVLIDAPSAQPSNSIYQLTPAQVQQRTMVDRHGKVLVNSNNNYLTMHTFTDLLNSLYQRAISVDPNAVSSTGSGVSGWRMLTRGLLVIIDIKGNTTNSTDPKSEYSEFFECYRELTAWENANKVDLGSAVIFKVGYANILAAIQGNTRAGFPPASGYAGSNASAPAFLASQLTQVAGYQPGELLPGVLLIVFPQDACSGFTSGVCNFIPPANNTQLNAWLTDYPNSTNSAFLVADWQHRTEGDSLTSYLTDSRWVNRGSAAFLASNNFSGGVRNSAGNCKTTKLKSNPAPYNTSFCTSDPMQAWTSTAIDYLVPAFGPAHASIINTDQVQNALDYLTAIGMNNLSQLK